MKYLFPIVFLVGTTALTQTPDQNTVQQAAAIVQAEQQADQNAQYAQQCQMYLDFYAIHNNQKHFWSPTCQIARDYYINYQRNLSTRQTLAGLFNGPDGKQWLQAYAWAKTNGCEPKLVLFHPHKTRQAIKAYKEARMTLPEDERERVVALCGK